MMDHPPNLPPSGPQPPKYHLQKLNPIEKFFFLIALGAGILIGLAIVLWPGSRHPQPQPTPIATVPVVASVTATAPAVGPPAPLPPCCGTATPTATATPIYFPDTGTGGCLASNKCDTPSPNVIHWKPPEVQTCVDSCS